MNEEMNKQNAELNDAALESVSGGIDANLARAHAEQLCNMCLKLGRYRCEHASELRYFIQKNGPLNHPWDCPYFND